jgi:predicted transposase YdaD
LSDRLEVVEIRRITEEIGRQGKGAGVRAYVEAVLSGNLEKIEEAFRMSDMVLTMDQLLENVGLTAKWEARGEVRGQAIGEEKKALEIARNLLGSGFSVEQTAKLAGLAIEKVEALAE